jgi:hypothetical protein
LRNSVPEAAPFPINESESAARRVLHQILVYGEANDFAEPLKSEGVKAAAGLTGIGCVRIRASSERVIVSYEYDYGCGGLPPRQTRPGVNVKEERVVVPGSWVRVRYNGRFSRDEWWYEKVVVNVGLFRRPDADIFILTEPGGDFSDGRVEVKGEAKSNSGMHPTADTTAVNSVRGAGRRVIGGVRFLFFGERSISEYEDIDDSK